MCTEFWSGNIMEVKQFQRKKGIYYRANNVTGHGWPCGSETSRIPHFLNNVSEVLSLIRRLPFAPGSFLVLISVRGCLVSSVVVQLDGFA
jgi:hypothetical protein